MLLIQNNNWKLGTSNKGKFCGVYSQSLWIDRPHSKALQHKLKPILPSTTFSAWKNDTYIGEYWIMLSFLANTVNNKAAKFHTQCQGKMHLVIQPIKIYLSEHHIKMAWTRIF